MPQFTSKFDILAVFVGLGVISLDSARNSMQNAGIGASVAATASPFRPEIIFTSTELLQGAPSGGSKFSKMAHDFGYKHRAASGRSLRGSKW